MMPGRISVTDHYFYPDDHASRDSDWLRSRNRESNCSTTGKGWPQYGLE